LTDCRQTTTLPPLRITPGKSVSQLHRIFVSRPAASSVNQRTVTVAPSEFEAARLGSNLRRAVNKCNLSTGENGEFARKSLASAPNPWGSGCSPSDTLLETERTVDPRPAECLGYGRLENVLLSTKTVLRVGAGEYWLPIVDAFRTLVACPPPAIRAILQQVHGLTVTGA
jgi:hypothetical protein